MQSHMDSSDHNPERITQPAQQPYINPNTSNPLQFTIRLSNSNPNPNSNSAKNTADNSSSSIPDSNVSLVSNEFFSVPIPRKRRRGRPRNTTSSVSQVYNIPPLSTPSTSSSSLGSSSAQFFSDYTPNNYSSKKTLAATPLRNVSSGVSEEIIVINREATSEALTALSAGFPADSLTEEEIDAKVVSVVGGIEQVNYILVRNHIISKWRENVSQWLSKDSFVNIVPSHCAGLLDSAYNYLTSRGYINFGVAPGIKEKILAEPSKPSVIIIGAGLSGLAAARQLMSFGFKVTVLEGRKRAGGRVYTKKMEGGNKNAFADLGGSVLTGTLGNPLGILARQLSCTLHKIRDKCPIYRLDGKPVDADLDQKVETAFNQLLDKASTLRQSMGEVSEDVSLGAALETFWPVYAEAFNEEEMRLFDWHLANLEYANAGLLSKLSLAFWDQDDPYDMGGDHCFLSGGSGRLVQALAENVPILYEKTVHSIRYGSEGVQVVAGSQVFEGDMALCTVSLGVLKNGSIKFVPELPQRKLDCVKRLGFGLLNKVAMLFPYVFWSTELDTFGHLTEDRSHRGEFFLFYSYATVAGGALLIALVAGEAAHTFEKMPPTDAVTKVLEILKGIFVPQGIEVPEPIQTVCTRWGADPFCLGSYSNVAVGASGADYDILAESVGDGRLFFAGEATNRLYPATMHGAFLSGFREAAKMCSYESVRAMKSKVEKNPSTNAHSCASILADLFREPDLEFGSFSVIFGKETSDLISTAILRVTFSGTQKRNAYQHCNKVLFQQLQSHFNQQQELHVYALISRQQALELREVRGGDEMRLYHICEKFGVNLVGRKGLGPSADSVISSIKIQRGKRKTLKSGTSKYKGTSLKQKMVRKAKIIRRATPSAPLNSLDGNKVGVGTSGSNDPPNVPSNLKPVGDSNGGNPPTPYVEERVFSSTNSSIPDPHNLPSNSKSVGDSNGCNPSTPYVEERVFSSTNSSILDPHNLPLDIKSVGDSNGCNPSTSYVEERVFSSTNSSIPVSGATSEINANENNLPLDIKSVGDSNGCNPSTSYVEERVFSSTNSSIPVSGATSEIDANENALTIDPLNTTNTLSDCMDFSMAYDVPVVNGFDDSIMNYVDGFAPTTNSTSDASLLGSIDGFVPLYSIDGENLAGIVNDSSLYGNWTFDFLPPSNANPDDI